MKKVVFLILLSLFGTYPINALSAIGDKGKIQGSDIKSLTAIKSAGGTITGNLATGSPCIALPSSTSGLIVGMYVYDTTTSANIPDNTTIAALPGACPSGQIRLSANAANNATGDTITFGGTGAQLVNDSQIWASSVTPAQTLSSAITNGLIGSGGGGALQWIEDGNAPLGTVNTVGNRIYAYSNGLTQYLYTTIKLPNTYTGGLPIKLYVEFYSPGSSGNVLIQSIATLVRQGTDAITSTTNQRTSTNSVITLSGGTVDKPQVVILDLTDSVGAINSVAVTANSLILVQLTRSSDTATSDVQVLPYSAEVTLH